MQNNNLTGKIPKEIGNLTELWGLFLASNNLIGEIPNTLSSLTELYNLTLQSNAYLTANDEDLISFINEKNDYDDHDGQTNYEYIVSTNEPRKLAEFEKQILIDIYTKLGGADWIGEGLPCYNWQGVTCTDGVITRLNLSNKNLTGYIPKSIGSLSFLTSLNLEYNKLTGSIPKEIGNLTSLGSLSIHHNKLSGEIPKEIGNLGNLFYFIAHSNCNLYSNNNDMIEYINKKSDMSHNSDTTYDTIIKTNTNDCNGLSPIYYLLLN